MKNYDKTIIFLLCYLVVFLFMGCSGQPNDLINNDLSSDDLSSNDLNIWNGKYKFHEFAPPNINMSYTIDIFEENTNYYANITIDGFQTMTRIRSVAVGDSDTTHLIFESYLPDNLYELYSYGDVLLSFKREDTAVLTEWGALTPLLPENEIPNKVYFENVKQ